MDFSYLSASDGTGDASLMQVTGTRAIGATTINVNTVTGVPAKFVATSGTLLASGFIDPTTKTDFFGHLNAGSLVIDGFSPGNTDKGNSIGQVVVIKPSTPWANKVAEFITNGVVAGAGGWNVVSQAPVFLANNGSKEFTCTVPTDLTAAMSGGMKVKMNRVTAPPTQAMSFTAASSQYATKASPSGITFTSAFTCEAWVYLNSYTNQNQAVVSRWDTTNGFVFYITPSGQVELQVGSGGGVAQQAYNSYQSIPLKRWVHISGSMNVTGGTGAIYINGVLVPSIKVGTATTMTQAGNLNIGTYNTGAANSFFDGYISEARLWSAAQTQAQIRANMAISLIGTETNLVGLWQGNGNFNDKTANANNLTAAAGAIATQAANPYNATEYGLLTGISYNSGTGLSTLTVFAGTDYNIPNQALTNLQYSMQRAPYGFPVSRAKWQTSTLCLTNLALPVGALNTSYDSNMRLALPAGDWKVTFEIDGEANSTLSSSGNNHGAFFVAQTASSTDPSLNKLFVRGATSSATNFAAIISGSMTDDISLAAQTVYSVWFKQFSFTGGAASMNIRGDVSPSALIAECAYI